MFTKTVVCECVAGEKYRTNEQTWDENILSLAESSS